MAEDAVMHADGGAMAALRALIGALPEPVLLVASDGVVMAANRAAEELFAMRLRGADIRAHLRQPEATAMIERALARTDAPGRTYSAQMVQGTASAEITWQITARALSPQAGLSGVVVSLHDVSHREAAEAQRRDFIANVSHELRSPLTVLAGFIETLQGPAAHDLPAQQEFLAIMAREAQRMTGLVADLLSLSRLEGNERIRPRDRVSVLAVLQATTAALRPQIEAAGIEIIWNLPDPLPELPGDHDQLVQVFHNLIENAIKYGGDGGSITLSVRHLNSCPGLEGPLLGVAVTDRGEGIDPIHIPRLTERFYRVDRARSRERGGTGLGLAIVKHILNRHRGRLVIRSAPGEGSTFEALLPCAPELLSS